jgi:hypothetical protein
MSFAKQFSPAEIESVYSAANSAVWHSHAMAGNMARGTPREEDYVATLVTDGVALLADRWSDLLNLKGIGLRISGVFCHGHPQVEFATSPNPIELADLLVVHQHLARAKHTARAALIQAKMSTSGVHRLHPGDAQLVLYSTWPPFQFVTGGLTPGFRDLSEVGEGSRYALILAAQLYPEQIVWADQCPWASCSARQDLSAERSFSKFLGDMLLEMDGRSVQLVAPQDAWSRTIMELLEITGKRIYRRTNLARSNTPRIFSSTGAPTGTLFLSQSPTFTVSDTPSQRVSISETLLGGVENVKASDAGGVTSDEDNMDASEGGLSALIIETQDIDLR